MICVPSIPTNFVAPKNLPVANRRIDAPVWQHLDPIKLGPGPEWSAQLFLTNNGAVTAIYPNSIFRPQGITTDFGRQRYFLPQTNAVAGVRPGQSATFLVRVWRSSFGGYEAASQFGFVRESLPVTVTAGDLTNPAPLVGLQYFEAGPFELPRPKLGLKAGGAFDFLVEGNGAALNTIELSTDLKTWTPYLNIFSKLERFETLDHSRAALGESSHAWFFRLKAGHAFSPSLVDWQRLGISHYRYKFGRFCFCAPRFLEGTVEVSDGQIVRVTDINYMEFQLLPRRSLKQLKSYSG